jgi:ferredoxin
MANIPKNQYPLNKGDFYINNGDCISCGAPQAEAPDIIEHGSDGHCYFKKQPQTEIELDQAIGALMVSCISALRYGGTEEKILKRLYEDGLSELCDRIPIEKYTILIRDRVSLNFDGRIDELASFLIQKYISIGTHVKVEKVKSDGSHHFSFVKRWTGGANALIYNCDKRDDGGYTLKIGTENEKEFGGMIGNACLLHDFLKTDSRITNIRWFTPNMAPGACYDKPY